MPKKPLRTIRFIVPNIVCSGCAQTIKAVLNNANDLPLEKVYVNWPKKEVTVVLKEDTTLSDKEALEIIKKELDSVDFKIESTRSIYSYIFKGIVGSVLGLALLIIMACGFTMPMIAMYLIAGLSTLLTLYLGFDTYKSSIMKLIKARKITMDALFTVSTITAIAVSIAALFVPWLPMMFDVALLIFGFRNIGIAIEEAANRKVMKGVAFRDRIPSMVEIEEINGEKIERKQVSISTLKPGDIIIVRGGEIIPVDGFCADGESYVYETIFNGNTMRRIIRKRHPLLGGMKVGENVEYMRVRVTATEENSYPTRLDKRSDDAQVETAPIENTAEKILRYFVPIVFGLALVSGIVISCFFPPALAIQCAVATLVSACPCTLGFIIPLAVNIGIGKGRDYGVEFKGGKAVQSAAKVNTIVFDLNGTLTTGVKTVTSVVIKDKKLSKEQIADYLYLLEKESTGKHEVASAICQYATTYKSENLSKYHFESTEQTNRSGVRYKIDGKWYTLGNRTMMANYGIKIKSHSRQSSADQKIYLARGKKIIAIVNVADPLRKDAKKVINQLKQLGNEIYICTGADRTTAKSYADKLGIAAENIRADCIPFKDEADPQFQGKQSKTDVVRELKKRGRKVAFVGDGANDVPAMEETCGILMKSHLSDAKAEDAASVIIESRSLKPLVATFAVAKQTIKNVKVSLAVSLAYNMATLLIAGGLLVAVGFTLNPAIGVALMIVQACLILGVAYYFKRKQLPKLKAYTDSSSSPNEKSSTFSLKKFFKAKPAVQLGHTLSSQEPQPQNKNTSSPSGFSARMAGLFCRRRPTAKSCENTSYRSAPAV